MNKKSYSFIFFLLLIISLNAVPFTTLGGVKVPNAYILPNKMMQVSAVSYFTAQNDSSDYETEFGYVFTYGLLDYLDISAVYSNGIFYSNLKGRLVAETEIMPAIAIGVDNLFSGVVNFRDKTESIDYSDYEDIVYKSDLRDYIENSFYFVVTKSTIIRGLPLMSYVDTKLHIGMGKRRFEGGSGVTKKLSGIFWALELRPTNNFGMLAEWDGINANIGLSYDFKNFTVRSGLYAFEEIDRNKLRFAFNIKYTFDLLSNVKFKESSISSSPTSRSVMSSGRRIISSDDFIKEQNPLDSELENLKKQREKTAKELEEIRKLLEED